MREKKREDRKLEERREMLRQAQQPGKREERREKSGR